MVSSYVYMSARNIGRFKFGGWRPDRQTAKFKSPPNFLAIRYVQSYNNVMLLKSIQSLTSFQEVREKGQCIYGQTPTPLGTGLAYSVYKISLSLPFILYHDHVR